MVTIETINTTDSAQATANPPPDLSYPSQKRKHDQMKFIAAAKLHYKMTTSGPAPSNVNTTVQVPEVAEVLEEPAEMLLWLQQNKWSLSDTGDDLLFAANLDESVLKDLEEAAKEDGEPTDDAPVTVNATATTATSDTTSVTAKQGTTATVTDPKPPRMESQIPFNFERPTNRSVNANASGAMIDFQRSYDLLSNEEKQGLFNMITPKTGNNGHNELTTPLVPKIPSLLNANSLFPQPPSLQPPPPPLFSYSAIQNTSFQGNNGNIDPLIEVMSQPRLTVFQALIKELGKIALAATDALETKTSAARKLHDPEINATPRSIRQNNFSLTTIKEFRDRIIYKDLQRKVAEHCEQHKQALAAIVKELAMHEITWLKILRFQQIITSMKLIISSIVFRIEQTIERPEFPAMVKINNLHFFLFYWMLQMNVKQSNDNQNVKSHIDFFGLPFNDIAATAATILIENSPQAVADVIEKLNSPELNWDLTNQQMGRYLTSIINDLDLIMQKAVVDHVNFHQAIKKEKIVEAQTLAFVNKQRVTTATVLTQNTLAAVSNKIATASINEQDMRLRQQELETNMAKTQATLNSLLKEQQKNSQGGSSAPTPNQFKPTATNATAARTQPHIVQHPSFLINHPRFHPPPLHKPTMQPPAAHVAPPVQQEQKNKATFKKRKHFKKK